MAIDRGPWNALVDDDGSNLVGTVWNKDKIKTVILDPTDAAIGAISVPPAVSPAWTVVQTTAAGGINNWDPGIVGHTIVVLGASAAVHITGIKPAVAPFLGQIVRVVTVPGPMTFYHEQTDSDPAYRFHLRAATMGVTGFWGIAEFQFMTYGGTTGWIVGVLQNGQ